jgi:hypothetical protein
MNVENASILFCPWLDTCLDQNIAVGHTSVKDVSKYLIGKDVEVIGLAAQKRHTMLFFRVRIAFRTRNNRPWNRDSDLLTSD